MSKRSYRGLPLIEKQDDCPRGGLHDDAPVSYGLKADEDGAEIRFLFCKKCHLMHWVEVKIEPPAPEQTTHDENPLLDGLPHA